MLPSKSSKRTFTNLYITNIMVISMPKKKLLFIFLIFLSCKTSGQFFKINAKQILYGVGLDTSATGDSLIVDSNYVKLFVTGGGGSSVWGGITGTLSNQTDLQNALNTKLNTSDTAAMLINYAELSELPNITGKLNISDTLAMLSNYLAGLSLRVKYADTASMLSNYLQIGVANGSFYPLNTNPSGYLTSASITGKLNISDTSAMLANYLQSGIAASVYATISNLALKVNISDTASMLSPYLRSLTAASTYATIGSVALKVNISDTAAMLSPYLRSATAAATYSTISNLALKVNISDTAAMLSPYLKTALLRSLIGDTIVIQTADTAITSTTLINVRGDSVFVAANTQYVITVASRIGSTGNGGRFAMVTPSGATIELQGSGNSNTNTQSGNTSTASGTEISATFMNVNSAAGMVFLNAWVSNGATPGWVKLQARVVTSGTFTVFAGLRMIRQKVY